MKLYNPTRRNTQCRWLEVESVSVLFSYDTPVALRAPGMSYRRNDDWGPTTRKHMKEAGVADFERLDAREFNEALHRAFVRSVVEPIHRRLTA